MDRLTDQIVTRLDDRLIAHRERFGRRVLNPREGDAMALAKLQVTVEHTGDVILPFNPEEYTLNQDNTFASQAIPGLSGPILQFVNGNMQTLEMELLLRYLGHRQRRRSGRPRADRPGRQAARDRQGTARAAGAAGAVGELDFRCVLARANQKFQMFADDGRPVRARVSVTFNRYHRPRARGEGGQPADRRLQQVPRRGGGRDAERRSPRRYYDDPRLWRPIALANALTDPRALGTGQALRIPSLPYHSPETGEVVR